MGCLCLVLVPAVSISSGNNTRSPGIVLTILASQCSKPAGQVLLLPATVTTSLVALKLTASITLVYRLLDTGVLPRLAKTLGLVVLTPVP